MALVAPFGVPIGVAEPAQPSRPSRLREPKTSWSCTSGALLGLALSYPKLRRSQVQRAARRESVDPLEHLTPRAEGLSPGERWFRQVYRPSTQGESDEEPKEYKKRRGKAAWLAANQEKKKDPSYGKKWVLDPKKKGPKKKRWAVGEVVDETQDIDKKAARLRTMYKRPRFDWKEVKKDDLRTESLSGSMAAIGTDEVWISKFLSHSGVCSRRRVKELVLQGRITVNGEVIQDPVLKVDPKKDTVAVDGKVQNLRTLDELVWVMLHKPKDVLSTLEDPAGRKHIADLVPFAKARRLVPVGRLERNATGIMFLTNDYEWHTVLAHPRYEMTRRYRIVVYNGAPDTARLQALQRGLQLPDEARPCLPLEDLEVLENDRKLGIATLGFVMREGRYRQILRMFEYIGHPLKAVKRTAIGLVPLDKELKAGEHRMLTPKEIRRLKGSTILKRPSGDPMQRAKAMERVFEGYDEPDSPRRRLPEEPLDESAESFEDLRELKLSNAEVEDDDWESGWIQQLDEMTQR